MSENDASRIIIDNSRVLLQCGFTHWWCWGIIFWGFHLIFVKNFFLLPDMLNKNVSELPGPPFPQTCHFTHPLLKCLHLLKMPPFLIMLLISFSFNNAAIFCINTCVHVLINQYSTRLFVSYSVRRKSH
jgi:hypothetical protein